MFFQNKNLIALDIGTSSVKLAELDLTARGAVLRKFGIMQLPEGAVSGGEILDFGAVMSSVEGLVLASKSKRKSVATGLWGNAVIIKKISMPKMDAKLVAEQLKWEAEQYIPFDINEVSLEYHILKSRATSAETMEVLLIAAKQDYIFRYIEVFESLKLKTGVIDVAGFALANCFEANYGVVDRPVALINVGAGVTNFVIVEKGEVQFCRDIPSGGSFVTIEIAKSMHVSVTEAEALKLSASFGQEVPAEVHSIITSATEQIVEEIKNGFDFYAATGGNQGVSQAYVAGGSVFLPGLIEQASRAVGVAFEALNPFLKISYDSKAFTPNYIEQIKAVSPVALGLGLRKLADK